MARSKVVVVRGKGVLTQEGDIHQKKLSRMYNQGLQILADHLNPAEALSLLFKKNDRVGIKINTIAGRKMSSHPDVSLAMANLLKKSGIPQRNIIIWDRTNRELKDAGYHLSLNRSNLKVLGTDTDGIGYSIVAQYSDSSGRIVTNSIINSCYGNRWFDPDHGGIC